MYFMPMNFSDSKTKINLMKAFAGESQARNRYYFAADEAKKQKCQMLYKIFIFTAEQEKAHAEVFYNHLKEFNNQTIQIESGFPVNISCSLLELLKQAEHNETEEYADVYKNFGDTATEEGFAEIAFSFYKIAEIENEHAKRFKKLYDLLAADKLFSDEKNEEWMCLNCGHIQKGEKLPEKCPVCSHDRGYFIRLNMAPYSEK
jgi:rubrerythrin